MGSSNRIFLWVLGLLLLGGVLWYAQWFFTHFERQTRQERTGISPEARKNRFLAAQMFLAKNGLKVKSQSGRDIFALHPSTRDTIFLGSHSRFFLERNGSRLIEWVRNGGNLILVPDNEPFEKDDPLGLFQELGVELRFVEEDKAAECKNKKGKCKSAQGNDKESIDDTLADPEKLKKLRYHTVTFRSDDPGEFKAQFLRDRYLLDNKGKAEVVVGDDGQPNLLMYSLGEGSITVLSDVHLFRNTAIGDLDHAYLFNLLADRPGTIWIFYSADMPSLLMLLWQHTPYLLLVLCLLILLAGWGMLRKSGPQLKPQFDSRRNLLEHLNATAEYSWRTDKARQLFDDNRTAVEQAWRRRHPQLNTLNQEQRCEWIADKTGLAARAVERTLYDEMTSEQDFIRATSVMQKLAIQANHHHPLSATDRTER